MILKRFYTVTILGISFLLLSFSLPNNILKKIKKEIKAAFSITDFELKGITISEDINQKLTYQIGENHLFKIESKDKIIGYAYVDKAASKTDTFEYLILLDPNLIIAKAKILMYREYYGGEIGSKRWLKQFIGKKATDTLQYRNDIMAISGATISASSMTKAVNRFLQNLAILHQNNIL